MFEMTHIAMSKDIPTSCMWRGFNLLTTAGLRAMVISLRA